MKPEPYHFATEEPIREALDQVCISPFRIPELDKDEAEELTRVGMSLMENWPYCANTLPNPERERLIIAAENMLYFAEDIDTCYTCAEALICTAGKLGKTSRKTKVTTWTMDSKIGDYVSPVDIADDWEWTDEGFKHTEEEFEGWSLGLCGQLADAVSSVLTRFQKIPKVGSTKTMRNCLWGTIPVLLITALLMFHPGISAALFTTGVFPEWLGFILSLVLIFVLFKFGLWIFIGTLLAFALFMAYGLVRRIVVLAVAGMILIIQLGTYFEHKELLEKGFNAEHRTAYLTALNHDALLLRNFLVRTLRNSRAMYNRELRDAGAMEGEEGAHRQYVRRYMEVYIKQLDERRERVVKVWNDVSDMLKS